MRFSPAVLVRVSLLLVSATMAPLAPVSANTGDDAVTPEKRVALVIGNGAYGDLGRLPNPPNDASDIAAALEGLNFEVTLVTDGDADEMVGALRDFGEAASGADVALFFYAGHGMAMDGENYLVPVHAEIRDKLSLRYGALNLSDVRYTLEQTDAPLKMVILDACRDNPLAKLLRQNSGQSSRGVNANAGLVSMDVDRGGGWYIAYATESGNVALDGKSQRNSPFTKALLAHIGTENVDVRVMFGEVRDDVVRATDGAQTPWAEDAMRGGFQFNRVALKPVEPAVPDDLVAWKTISGSDEPVVFEEFLKKFPDSYLASAAEAKLRQLRDPAAERAAWDAAQASNDPALFERFLRNYPSGPYAGAARTLLQSALGSPLLLSNDPRAMEAYIARFPDSPWTAILVNRMATLRSQAMATPPAAEPAAPPAQESEAGRALELTPPAADVSTAPAAPPFAPEADLSLRSLEALRANIDGTSIQFALKALGYYSGEIDGKLGPGSRRAAFAFQASIGAPVTGDLKPAEIVALMGEAAKSGDPASQTIYGGMFAFGAGVRQDLPASVEWYRRAAESGNGYGQLNLGIAYLDGFGVERDLDSARRWLTASAAQNIPEAATALERLDASRP